MPRVAAFAPSSSGKSTACPKNPRQSTPTFNQNLFCYRLSLWFLSLFRSGRKNSLFISSLFKYLSYSIMSSPSVLPAQDSTSLILAVFLQKSHFETSHHSLLNSLQSLLEAWIAKAGPFTAAEALPAPSRAEGIRIRG